MSIEGGSGGGSGGGSVGGLGGGIEGSSAGVPAVSGPSFIAPSFEAAPAGGLGSFGPKFEGSLTTIVNEGPVSFMDLKNTMPLVIGKLNPIKEIRFNEHLTVPSVIAEAEAILAQARKPAILPSVIPSETRNLPVLLETGLPTSEDPSLIVQDDKRMGSVIAPQIEPMIAPVMIPNALEFPKPHVAASSSVEPVTKAENVSDTQTGSQQQIESLVKPRLEGQETEEIVVSERVVKNKQIEIVEEREAKRKKRFVVDKPVLARRLSQIRLAIQEAVPMAERLGYGKRIIGWILEKSLSLTHPEDLSQVVRPDGPDGTLSIIRETIKAKNEFHSAEEVQAVVLANRPVSIKEEGEPVSDEEVRKVFQDRMVKPANKAMEIMESRVVKKVHQLPGQSLGADTILPHSSLSQRAHPSESKTQGWTEVGQGGVKLETNLEDLGLAEVFQKAA